MEYYTLFEDMAVGAEVVNNKSNTEHSSTRSDGGPYSQKVQLIAEETLVPSSVVSITQSPYKFTPCTCTTIP